MKSKSILKTQLTVLFICFSAFVGVAQTFTVSGLDYEVTSTNPNEVQITGGTPATSDLVIPQTVSDGGTTFTVTSVGDSAFKDRLLTAVTFPSTIVTIADQAFRNNQFTSLTLPEGVTSIGFLSFQGSPLTSLNLPTSLISIGELAFVGAPLTSLTLPEGLVTIGDNAFRDNQLTSLTIPSTVTSIGARAFENNPLTTINSQATTPPTITTGANDTFSNRDTIDLTIPPGTEAAYENAGWTGFNSINGVINILVGTTFTVNNLNYRVTALAPNEVEVTGGTDIPTDLTFPETVSFLDNDFTLVTISGNSFSGDGITAITLPNTIRTISASAFAFNNITTLNIPNSVTTIGGRAFEVNQLTGLVLPNSVTELSGDRTFAQNQLTNITLSENMTTIVGRMFAGNQITNITIPASIQTIESSAFSSNVLGEITIPEGVTTIGNDAFANNPLTAINSQATTPPSITTGINDSFGNRGTIDLTIPPGTEAAYDAATWTGFRTVNGILQVGSTFTDNNLNYKVTSLIPDEVQLTGGSPANATLVVPENVTNEGVTFAVTSIGARAFETNNLTAINSLATTPPSITTGTNDSFGNRDAIDLTIPPGTEEAYAAATWTGFNSVNGVVIFEIGETFVDNNLDYEVTSLMPNEVQLTGGAPANATLVIPENVTNRGVTFTVTSVGDSAFKDALLTAVTFPATIITIEDQAFRNNQFTSLTLPEGLTSIGDLSFQGSPITSLSLPTSLTSIGSNAFVGAALTSLVLSEGLITIGEQAFRNNQLTNLILPSTVTNVGARAFEGNPLTTINSQATTPPTITTGTDDTFSNRDIIDLTIPPGTEAFYEAATWTGFFSVNGIFQVGSTFTDNNLNYEVTSLTPNEVQLTGGTPTSTDLVILDTVTINGTSYTVTSVGFEAFKDALLTAVTFPETIISIEEEAFRGNLFTNITLPDNLTSLESGAFQSNQLESLNLPASLTSIGNNAFLNNSITNLTLSEGLQTIGNDAFRNNELTNLTLSEGLVTIGNEAFRNNQLTNLTLPSTVTNVGANAFENNPLTAINSQATVPPSITTGTNDSFGNRIVIDLTIPPGTEVAYQTATWTGFQSINGIQVGTIFTDNSLNFSVISLTPYEVEITGGTLATTELVIPETVSNSGISFTVTRVGTAAFQFANIVNLTIPASVNNIESLAFNANGSMRTVSLLNPNPPFLQISGFSNRRNIQLTVPEASLDSYLNNNQWNSSTNDNDPQSAEDGRRFFSINSVYTSTIGRGYIVDNLVYESINRNEAVAKVLLQRKNTGSLPSNLVIPDDFIFRNTTFTITEIDANALDNEGLVNVTLPSGLESIGSFAFGDNPLETITTTDSSPAFEQVSSFGDRSNTDLFVPAGTTQAYVDAGWTGFRLINELAITVNLKVFLQGAAINPIAGEEDLMRDSLRENGLLPTTSPYGDGATVDPVVFTTTGPDAIVDWVLVELRSGADNENTTVVTSQAAFIQRDGDIVGLDGTSTITFTEDAGDYFIAIKHRNHIGILTAVPAPLSGAASTVDFTQDVTVAKGENLALTEVNGTFAMIAGDADGSSQILNTDITEALTLAGGGQAYSTADADMNGFVLNSDIQLLILRNSGTVQQFE